MEHVIVSSLMDHLRKNNILSPRQHGFRRKKSCETQLLEFMEELTENMEACKQTDTVIMDFAKAFDKVNHSLLLHKLHNYGVRGQVNRWIADFLQDRKQTVVVDGAKSDPVAVKSGVPQGSVLGPNLFLVYINDLPGTVSSPVRLFADDTAIYRPITTGQDQTCIEGSPTTRDVGEELGHVFPPREMYHPSSHQSHENEEAAEAIIPVA